MFALTVNLAKGDSDVMAKLGHYFKALYDEDLLEEELLISWCGRVFATHCGEALIAAMRSHAELDPSSEEAKQSASFIQWLS